MDNIRTFKWYCLHHIFSGKVYERDISFSSSLDPKDYLEKVVKVEHEDGLTWLVTEEGKRYGFRDGSPTKLLVSDKSW